MTTEGITGETPLSTKPTERIRDEMLQMVEEIAKGGERAASVKKKFEALWKQIPEPGEPTVH